MTLTFSVLKYASKFIAFVYKYYENQKKKKKLKTSTDRIQFC